MDPEKPPVICHYCGDPIDPGAELTLGVRQREHEGGEGIVEDVAAFHPPCWEAFQREHGLI